MKIIRHFLSYIFLLLLLASTSFAKQAPAAPRSEVAGIPVNYDEAKVVSYTLPDPLTLTNGKPVRDAKTWTQKRRPEIVRMFEENQFGRSPGRPAAMSLIFSIKVRRRSMANS